MGLTNARFQPSGAFSWNASSDTLTEQIKIALESNEEMGLNMDTMIARIQATSFYSSLYADAFGTPTVTPEYTFQAIGQFVRSMVSFNSPYDSGLVATHQPQAPFPNFTAQENLGKSIFFGSQGCANCHISNHFTMNQAMNNGLDLVSADPGLGAITGLLRDHAKFKAPSLRNIALTAPYMHDGRFQTLEEVVDHYSSGIQNHPNLGAHLFDYFNGIPRQFNFSEQEKDALVAFLHTLTDIKFITDPRWQNPFGLDSIAAIDSTAIIPLAIDEVIDFSMQLTVAPNPFTDQLRLTWINPENKPATIRLVNLQGQQVVQQSTTGNQLLLERADLSPGIYWVEIRTGHRVFRKKIMKD